MPFNFNHRVILHVDLDAFYAQVEQVRLGIPNDRPLAIRQWNGLIAVNYAARPYGIKRSMTVPEALEKCPELQLVHVATYANGETEPQYHRNPTVATHKVSLEPYRRASNRIMNVFRQYTNVVVQKASVDEAFLDVTSAVRIRVEEAYGDLDQQDPPRMDWDGLGVVIGLPEEEKKNKIVERRENEEEEGESTEVYGGWEEVFLAEGARLAVEIRKKMSDELKYTCSAGVALDSKVLAKVCSGMNKPNNQTVLRPSEVLSFLKDQPFQKLWNMGGKFGSRVESELNVETCGDVWQFPLSELQRRFGEAEGTFLYEIVRGLDREEIMVRGMTKSMMAAKSLRPPVRNIQEAEHWLGILASELFTRVRDDYDDNQRWPKTLTLHYHPGNSKRDRSKSCAFPRRAEVTCPDVITMRAVRLFAGPNRSSSGSPATGGGGGGGGGEVLFPCIRFALAVGGLEKEESGMTEIRNFFTKGTTTTSSEEKPQNNVMTPVQPPICWPKGSTASVSEEKPPNDVMAPVLPPPAGTISRSSVASFFSPLPSHISSGNTISKESITEQMSDSLEKHVLNTPEFFEKPIHTKPMAPKKGIAKFFETKSSIRPGHDIQEDEATLFCDRCSVSVEPCTWDEHTDYHFALDLLKSEREKDDGLGINKGKEGKGRKVEEKEWKGKRRRKEDFFTPFRNKSAE